MAQRHWLVKSEPEVFSIDSLKRAKTTGWEGVRNYQARNYMRDSMKPGDAVFFYHSNAEPTGIAGLAAVHGPPVPDPTQFDKKSEYYDATSDKADPRWIMVNLKFVERFARVITLDELKADKALAGMMLLQKGSRLSVQEVTAAQFEHIVKLAQKTSK